MEPTGINPEKKAQKRMEKKRRKREKRMKRVEPKGSNVCSGSSICEGGVFNFKDLHNLRELYDGPGADSDTEEICPGYACLLPTMEKKRMEYFDESSVVFSYGVRRPGVQRPPRTDLRVVRAKEFGKDTKRQRARSFRKQKEVYERLQKNGIPPYPYPHLDRAMKDLGAPSLADEYLKRCTEILSKPPPVFEESPETPTDELIGEINSGDLYAVSMGLAFFNCKRSDQRLPPFYLVAVHGGHDHLYGQTLWTHYNFTACLRDGSPDKLFFLELYRGRLPTFCCILDGMPQKSGCLYCPKYFVHPEGGEFLDGINRDQEKDENTRLAIANGICVTFYKRPLIPIS